MNILPYKNRVGEWRFSVNKVFFDLKGVAQKPSHVWVIRVNMKAGTLG